MTKFNGCESHGGKFISLSVAGGADDQGKRFAMTVDDHAVTRQAHRRLLQHCGLEARMAGDGLEAIAIFLDSRDRDEAIDLILMDLDMPIVDGWSATATLRGMGYQGTIIAVSGTPDPEAHDRCLRSGFNAFIRKPGNPEDLINAITSFTKPLSRRAERSEVAA